jgi:hypothetical protein
MSTHTHTRAEGTVGSKNKFRITTQNMGGFGLEVRSHKNRTKTGPKMQYLRKSAERNATDVFVLTETRIKTTAECKNIRIGQLKPTMMTVSGRTAAGVIVLTNKNASFIEGSSRESNPAGHFIIGVYQIHGTRVIIGGVYLDSIGTDHVGVQAIQQINGHIEELQRAYNTQHTVLTGDFNVVIHADQCHSKRINKPQTSQHLQDMIIEYNLLDSGTKANNVEPTYRRHGDADIYSRIDYTFSSLATSEYNLQWGALDHACVDVCIDMPGMGGIKLPRTRDWIIGSTDFLTLGRETIIKTMLDHDQHFTYIEEQEMQDMVNNGIPEGFERRVKLANENEGITELHVLNVIISKLQLLAGRLHRRAKDRDQKAIMTTDSKIKYLHKKLANTQNAEDRQDINADITEQKIKLKDVLTQQAIREQTRIDTFTSTNRGRMTKCSFTDIKDKKAHNTIDKLIENGQDIHDQEQIATIMRDRYIQCTGQIHDIPDDAVLKFMEDMDITLPTLSDIQREQIGDEIDRDEVRQALQNAKPQSAPGPTGQTLGFYKYLFQQIPYIFTKCMNIITFYDDILDSPSLQWIKKRKVVYIPKPGKDKYLASSYRPLSLLEVLYKIPAKILTDRLGNILPDISYEDQHGFVPGRGAQYNTLSTVHAIQDAERTGKSLQLLGIDINGAFDSISRKCIKQCMILNGFPTHLVTAIDNLTKEGRAQIEVNGRLGDEFIQQSGVGQGDPLSAFRFNIGTEPLLRALHKHTGHCIYQDEAGTFLHPSAYADDHLHMLSARAADDVRDILNIYNKYTGVSGLHINPSKTELLTINTEQDLTQEIQERTGISTVGTLTLLGIKLTDTLQGSIAATYDHIDTKAITRQIRISTKKAHMLHRRLLIQASLAPMYTHAFMALGSTAEVNKKISDMIRTGLWTQMEGQEAKDIRVQVAYKRIFAGYDMGGLNIAHPQQVNEGLMLNTLERLIRKDREYEGNENNAPNIVRILRGMLEYTACTGIHEALRYGGHAVWTKMASKINAKNKYLGSCMYAMARLHRKLEVRGTTWYTAPLWGHTGNNPIMPLTDMDAGRLRTAGIHNIGHLYESGDGIMFDSHMPIRQQPAGVGNATWDKAKQIHASMKREQRCRGGLHITDYNIAIIRRTGTYSHINRKLYKEALQEEIKAPPSFYTRRADRLPLPSLTDYCKAYTNIMTNSTASTSAITFSFAVLNRTVWTAKKQALSGNAGGNRQEEELDTGNCILCGMPEDTAHILVNCNNYSYRAWERASTIITLACRAIEPGNGIINLTFSNIMYHTDILSLPQTYRKQIAAFLLEFKKDIYVRRTERCIGEGGGRWAGRIYTDQRIDIHISMACDRVLQMATYKGKTAALLEQIRLVCIPTE